MWRLVLMLLLLGATPGVAEDCVKPAPPACASARVPFDGQTDFDVCRKEMLAFRDEMDRRASCLGQTSAEAEKAARDEYEDVRVRFNKRARGEID